MNCEGRETKPPTLKVECLPYWYTNWYHIKNPSWNTSHTISRAEEGLTTCTKQRSHPRYTGLDLLIQDRANSAANVQQVVWTNVGVFALLKYK